MKNRILLSLLVFSQFASFGQNIVQNGDFSSGLNSWTSFAADFDGVFADFTANNEEAAITNMIINNAEPQIWHVQLFQEFTPGQIESLVVGQTYTVSFKARSSVMGRQLRMFLGQNTDPFQAINMTDFLLTEEMVTYEVAFNMNTTFNSMKLGFEMGLNNADVFIDDVSLSLGGTVDGRIVTFRLDMSGFDGEFTTPEVNGIFNNWCGNCNPMVNVGGDIWEATIVLQDGTYEYKFSYDNWAGQESLTPGSSCTVTIEQYTNRVLVVSDDVALPEVCWNYCVSCDVVSLDEKELTAVSIYPNPSTEFVSVVADEKITSYSIFDFTGKQIVHQELNTNELTIPISEFTNGLYSIQVMTNGGFVTRTFIKN